MKRRTQRQKAAFASKTLTEQVRLYYRPDFGGSLWFLATPQKKLLYEKLHRRIGGTPNRSQAAQFCKDNDIEFK